MTKDCKAIQMPYIVSYRRRRLIAYDEVYNGTNRARTYDPLLVRQVLSQLSYDPLSPRIARQSRTICRTHALYYHFEAKVKQILPISPLPQLSNFHGIISC